MKGKRFPNILLLSLMMNQDEEEPPIQPISLIRSSKKRIEPTHDVVKKKKRKRKRGKKISLPNNVAPIIVVPHENESKIIVEDDALDNDLVMPIAWKNMIIAILLVLSILLMMRVTILMI